VTKLTSAFGATAGFAAIMVWVYWTALIILVSAQVGRSTRDAFDAEEPRPDREAVKADITGRR
jgi:membrane protein